MREGTRLQILVCEHYAEDVRACIKELKIPGVRGSAFPAHCGHAPLTWDDLPGISADPKENVLLLGGPCLGQLRSSESRICVSQLRNCQEMLLDAKTLEWLQRGGAHILSSAWLLDWRRHLAAWGEDPAMMRESVSSLLCLNSGTGPENLEDEMAALGAVLTLPWKVLPVGQSHMRAFLEELVEKATGDHSNSALDSELNEARRQAADRAVALEFLSELSQTLLETDVQARMVAFFSMLFGASKVLFHGPSELLLQEGEEFRTTEEGFLVRLGRPDQKVGTLEVADLAFPQYRTYYLNLTLSVAGVCSLAVLNARTYQALSDAQASQQLMLDVLDSFYRPGEELQELETTLDYIQAYTTADSVSVRLKNGGAADYQIREFYSPHPAHGCDLCVRDEAGVALCHPDGSQVLTCLCGNLLSGKLPREFPGLTPRGTFWTNDLEDLQPIMEAAGLEGGLQDTCVSEGIHSMALVPLLSKNGILGLLQVSYQEAGRFTPALVDLLEGIAGSMSLGLERRFAEDRLKLMNQELESRVQKRTAELATINENLRAEIEQRTQIEQEKLKVEQQLFQAQKLEAIGTLAGGVAHDFNNILTPILAFAEMGMKRSNQESGLRRNFEMIIKAGERARDLVNQILLFSRHQGHDLATIHPAPVIKEVLKLIRASLPSTIEIRSRIQAEGARVLASPTQIHQIVMNLCTNASHAMEGSGGVLEVILERLQLHEGDLMPSLDLTPGAYVMVQISDTGCGIPKDVLARIFEPYFTTKEPGKGTGLGLSVVHGLVKSYRGHISVYSEPGQGTTFRIYLPEQVGTSAPQTPEAIAEIPGGCERILVVEDDDCAMQSIVSLLDGLGYRITAEKSSLEALEHLKREPSAFDLVITDMTMPKMTGLDLAREIQGMRPNLPVVLCSGYSQGLMRERMEDIGIRAFVQKPYAISHMAQTIRRVLAKA